MYIGKKNADNTSSRFRAHKYGRMGEVIENNRTFVLPNERYPYSFKMKYTYDSWNRVQDITYPDGEVVYYKYNTGGMLDRVYGQAVVSNSVIIKGVIPGPSGPIVPSVPSKTYTYNYIDSTRYNEFELKSGQWYGNGTRSQYTYDTLQRLRTLKSFDNTPAHRLLQDLTYSYDKVGNISSISNGNTYYVSMGGSYTYTYQYDSLYRIDTAHGNFTGGTKNAHYNLTMAYKPDGSILTKKQSGLDYTGVYQLYYDDNNSYSYNTIQPHTLSTVGATSYTWDANGNMAKTNKSSNPNSVYMVLDWDEENRLCHVDMPNNRKCARYQYDASGERFYKNVGTRTNMTQNGQPTVYREYDAPTLYTSPYLVVTPEGYTKHYFVESERFASRIGDGKITSISSHAVATSLLASKQTIVNRAAPDSIVANKFLFLRTLSANWSAHHTTYWLHPDHLGSTNWVTDTAGHRYQHMLYKPWGEVFVSQPTTTPANATRYKFSGKEQDPETGFCYFGARLHNPTLSIWLSVDPLSDKYPGVSPYVYCGNNPVRLVDKDGREIGDPPLCEIVDLGFQSKTFRKLFRKAGLTTENMSDIISFGNQSSTNPYTKKIILRAANSDIENVFALTHEMTNRINSKKLKNNMESVRNGNVPFETYADNAIRIESEGVANQIIIATELNYSFPEDKGQMNDLKKQYKEGTLNRRTMLKKIREQDFQDEFERNAKQQYYEDGRRYREAQIQRENQNGKIF